MISPISLVLRRQRHGLNLRCECLLLMRGYGAFNGGSRIIGIQAVTQQQASDRICAIGLAMFLPAISGASRLPVHTDQNLVRSGWRKANPHGASDHCALVRQNVAKQVEHSRTSNCDGSLISCMVALSCTYAPVRHPGIPWRSR